MPLMLVNSVVLSALAAVLAFACSATAKQKDPSGGTAGAGGKGGDESAGGASGTTGAGGGGGEKARPCVSSAECGASEYCTVEDGVCNRPPGCGPEDICPAVCFGTCAAKPEKANAGDGEPCGPKTCPAGQVCCNRSCGICTPPGGLCTQQLCEDDGGGLGGGSGTSACKTDRDCRIFSDYCTGCDCRALGRNDGDPVCTGPGVRCLVDPCLNKVAACEAGRCVARDKPKEK
jgi:hypothetical protein